ncbi:hypothetical protein THIOSC15_10003 [uncultured Thiomicrorhabdus sp.]
MYYADEVHLTVIDAEIEGDTHFPIDMLLESSLELVETKADVYSPELDEYPFKIEIYKRKA